MQFRRILVAVDSPDGRDAAFERGLALARSSGAELYLLHAVPVDQRFSFRAAERLTHRADLRKRAQAAGVRVQTVEQRGDPAEIIELHANARGADLIVMGSEPRRGWGRSRSAIAERVVRRTRVPALIVASHAGDTAAPFQKVLVALDLSPDSADVLRAAGLAAPEAARLTVLHTVKGAEAAGAVEAPGWWMAPRFPRGVLEDARRSLESLVAEVPADIDTRVQVSAGPAARTIVEHAADFDADLVVMGRSRGFKLLGSTALRVLRKNDRALLVIPGAAHRMRRLDGQRAA